MNLFKRLTTSVTATLEGAVGQLENHDAIIEANIKKTRQAVARTQARLATLHQQQANFESQLAQASEQVNTWEERARSLMQEDENKALQCLSRRNQSENDVQRLQATLEQQHVLISKVGDNLQKLKGQLDEMTQRHNLMRSRQAVAQSNKMAASTHQSHHINDTFEQWEATILENEIITDVSIDADPLQTQFEQQESESRLREQLKALGNTQPSS